MTDQRLLVLAVHIVRGEKVVSNPIDAKLSDVQITRNYFNETILVVPIELLEKAAYSPLQIQHGKPWV